MEQKKRILICIVIGILFSSIVTGGVVLARKEALQKEVASQVLRFHVLANSDSERDQNLKMKVKEAVLDFMKQELPEAHSLAETVSWAKESLEEIETVGEETLRALGCDMMVKAKVTSCQFPEKTYGDVTFPSGMYEALRIEIGAGKGQNWWCVLYPNLCFINTVHAVVPEEGKEQLEEVLDEDAYELVTSKTIFKIKWFFF